LVIWITGKAGAGKSTFAKKLQDMMTSPAVIIDGEEVRERYGLKDFSDQGRLINMLLASSEAILAEEKGKVAIVAMISPRKKHRDLVRKLFDDSVLVYVKGGTLWEGTEYEEPDEDEANMVYDWRGTDLEEVHD
jgi:adenylylsulfate kinase-like enzyme